jgi:hypothetical protein
MPTGCRSVYLIDSQSGDLGPIRILCSLPARDFESRPKDLSSHKFRHLDNDVSRLERDDRRQESSVGGRPSQRFVEVKLIFG